MNDIELLKQEIGAIKERNKRVELDKIWETSWARKVSIAAMTYIVVVTFFFSIDASRPFINAIVPTMGFLLSTLSMSVLKKMWVRSQR